jgi:hypothetical protein
VKVVNGKAEEPKSGKLRRSNELVKWQRDEELPVKK